MRSIMISFFIIIFCFSVNIINWMDDDYNTEIGRSLFGWTTPDAPIAYDTLDGIEDSSSFNTTVQGYVSPSEQQTGLGLQDFMAVGIALFKGLSFIFNTLINATVGFVFWIDDLGSGISFMEDQIVYTLAALVYANPILAMFQIITIRNLDSGGA